MKIKFCDKCERSNDEINTIFLCNKCLEFSTKTFNKNINYNDSKIDKMYIYIVLLNIAIICTHVMMMINDYHNYKINDKVKTCLVK